MRLMAFILILQIPRIHTGADWILCVHPDGNGFIVNSDSECCRPCDSGKTHCNSEPEPGPPSDGLGSDTHCEDFPLLADPAVMALDMLRRPTEILSFPKTDLSSTHENPASLSVRDDLGPGGVLASVHDLPLACLRSVVLRI